MILHREEVHEMTGTGSKHIKCEENQRVDSGNNSFGSQQTFANQPVPQHLQLTKLNLHYAHNNA